jgi:uncharacterized membrane protein
MTLPTPVPPPPRPRGFAARVRAYFFTGLVVAGPLAVTAWLVWWFVDTVDHWFKPLIPERFWPDAYLPKQVPGIGVVMGFVGLTLLGFFTANYAGRTLIRLGERILDRMPIVRSIYKSVKQIFETVFSQSGTSFRRVGLVEFPLKGQWSIVLISAPPSGAVHDALPAADDDYVSVFLPCTPNPTTGFFFYLPARDVIEIDISPDEAAKLVMSAGVIQPEARAKIEKLGEEGRLRKAQAAE